MRSTLCLLFVCWCSLHTLSAEPPSICSVTLGYAGQQRVIGTFQAKVGEEAKTVRSFSIPNTYLKATVAVYFTDESIQIKATPLDLQDTSVLMALDVGDHPPTDPFISQTASVAEAALVSKTSEQNLVRVLKVVLIGAKKGMVILECREK